MLSWLSVGLLAQLVERCTGIAEVMDSSSVHALIFSSLNFTTAQVVFITAKLAFIFTSLSAIQIYDFHIFTVIYSSLYALIWKQHEHQRPVGLLALLVERCSGTLRGHGLKSRTGLNFF